MSGARGNGRPLTTELTRCLCCGRSFESIPRSPSAQQRSGRRQRCLDCRLHCLNDQPCNLDPEAQRTPLDIGEHLRRAREEAEA